MHLILTAHGTRRPAGVAMIGDLAARVSALLKQTVQVAFVDVLGPTPSEVLGRPAPGRGSAQSAIVVPAFLSRGYHVRIDLPAHVAASGHPDVTVTPALGPSREIARILIQQLLESGWRPDDSVILAAAGTSDRRALDDLRTARAFLCALTGSPVTLGFAATGRPDLRTAVRAARRDGARRVVVVSYLLAEGLFQERLRACGADLVTPPLGNHPGLAELIATRFHSAISAAVPTVPRSPMHTRAESHETQSIVG
ncbi:Sirohydrochlorin cobaltochelatase [Mycobacterium marinum]|uniref:sirohydrochlorin chelatase n=1 Tax=Mycobacterium marinum TaxID=1781 RepID=UPI000E3E3806|nr:sirohydrochlorin chelatase [Mycobacterium marinum]MDC9004452.1 sirohydrochlorin chelatase [Mycobacterium marinum]RFZ63403.1 Sirohydrochlorin cobaltochelatase [Mycobacterium marinum]